jgi:ABC-type dipeptide/oligopeptide/nickel transport system ATPase component
MNSIELLRNGELSNIIYDKTIVFIGANGSGKSRLGAWIENENPKKVHRVSAQRNLSFNQEISLMSLSKSQKFFYFGNDFETNPGYLDDHTFQAKSQMRWQQGKFTTGFLNDYDHLLSMLYSQQNLRNEQLSKKISQSIGTIILEDFKSFSNIEKLIELWNKLLPHRQIEFYDQKILVKKESESYMGTELSDGERVIIYLIGQVLSVEPNFILIVDEPEIHIHKSIINPLWDELEKLRDDISIFYITHDLDFAKERFGSKKIWIKSFDGKKNWDFDEIDFDNNDEFNQIHFEIMGSRKPVLFIEGEKGSLDFKLYSKLYDRFTIIPLKSCSAVVEMVSSYKKEWTLHNIQPIGIIDKDFRNDREIELLNEKGVYTIDVLEVENLFCTPKVVEEIYSILSTGGLHFEKSKENILSEIQNIISTTYEGNLDKLIQNIIHKKTSDLLSKFPKPKHDEDFKSKYDEYINTINIDNLILETTLSLQTLIDENDISKIICLIDNKGLVSKVSGILGMHKERYISTVIKNIENIAIKNVFFEYLPKFED